MQGWINIKINECNIPYNRIKEKIIVSTDVERAFDKIQHPFVIKTLKLEIEENYLNIMKVKHEKHTAYIRLKG